MADTDFYNRNLHRAYPFVDSPPYVFPTNEFSLRALVDACVVFLEGSGFDASDETHKIYPREAGSTAIVLRISAPGANVDGVDIIVNPTTAYEVLPFTVVDGSTLWAYGYLVVGDRDSLPLSRPIVVPDATTSFLERRCIQVQEGHYVNRFILANQARTVAPERCTTSSSSASSVYGYSVAPVGDAIIGDVRFREGYNCSIQVTTASRAIRISARRGAGEGEACTEIPRTEAELLQAANNETLDNAVRCYETLSSINGINPDTAGTFRLLAGKGVEISSPSAHTIRIAGRDSFEAC